MSISVNPTDQPSDPPHGLTACSISHLASRNSVISVISVELACPPSSLHGHIPGQQVSKSSLLASLTSQLTPESRATGTSDVRETDMYSESRRPGPWPMNNPDLPKRPRDLVTILPDI